MSPCTCLRYLSVIELQGAKQTPQMSETIKGGHRMGQVGNNCWLVIQLSRPDLKHSHAIFFKHQTYLIKICFPAEFDPGDSTLGPEGIVIKMELEIRMCHVSQHIKLLSRVVWCFSYMKPILKITFSTLKIIFKELPSFLVMRSMCISCWYHHEINKRVKKQYNWWDGPS